MEIKGVLFDLDGVITDTAKFHFLAWQQLGKGMGIEIDEAFNETLKGVSRLDSLRRIAALGGRSLSSHEEESLMAQKNAQYLQYLESLGEKDILPGILELLQELDEHSIKVSIASVSRNAPFILDKLNLRHRIDAVANPEHVANSKPAPDIFIEAARLINVPLENCIGIEDSLAGIQSIHGAGMRSVGVGVEGTVSVQSTAELTLALLQTINHKPLSKPTSTDTTRH